MNLSQLRSSFSERIIQSIRCVPELKKKHEQGKLSIRIQSNEFAIRDKEYGRKFITKYNKQGKLNGYAQVDFEFSITGWDRVPTAAHINEEHLNTYLNWFMIIKEYWEHISKESQKDGVIFAFSKLRVAPELVESIKTKTRPTEIEFLDAFMENRLQKTYSSYLCATHYTDTEQLQLGKIKSFYPVFAFLFVTNPLISTNDTVLDMFSYHGCNVLYAGQELNMKVKLNKDVLCIVVKETNQVIDFNIIPNPTFIDDVTAFLWKLKEKNKLKTVLVPPFENFKKLIRTTTGTNIRKELLLREFEGLVNTIGSWEDVEIESAEMLKSQPKKIGIHRFDSSDNTTSVKLTTLRLFGKMHYFYLVQIENSPGQGKDFKVFSSTSPKCEELYRFMFSMLIPSALISDI